MWSMFGLSTLLVLLLPLERETVVINEEDLARRLKEIRAKDAYGLYGMIMTDKSDQEVREVVNNQRYRDDIADVSSKDCCFIYFKNPEQIDKPIDLYDQHADRVHDIAEWLDLKISKFPCFLFFERLEYKKHIYIPLQGKSARGIVQEVRQIFEMVRRLRKADRLSPYEAVAKYEKAQRRRYRGRAIIELFMNMSVKYAVEYSKPD